jgi:hypothetical protein
MSAPAIHQTAVATSSRKSSQITISRAELDLLLEQAAARGAMQLLSRQQAEYLGMAEASRYIYGRSDRVAAFRALRQRYPEIDTLSIGEGRFRRWKRADLDTFLANKPQFRRRAEKQRGQS